MNFNIVKIFVITVILFLGSMSFPSVAAVIGSTDDPMVVGGGARQIGMGRAFTAIADDCDASFVNPGGLAGLKGPMAMSMFSNLLGDVYYMQFSGAVPLPRLGTIGLGYIASGVNQIPTGAVFTDYYDSLFVLSYGSSLARYVGYGQNVFVGLNLKFFNRGYTGGINQFASGQSADFGIKLIVNPNLSFGLCRQNFVPVSMGSVLRLGNGTEESFASLTKIGMAVKPVPLPKLTLAFDTDVPMQSGRPVTSHIGAEWKENEYFSIRAGLDQSIDPGSSSLASWNPAIGTSLTYKGIRIDYAYHAYYNQPEIASQYIALSYIGQPTLALKGKVQ